jgi:predicted ATPase/GrpB-like predicted nucleotidyltransferase (UPF0157 family)
MNTEPIKRFILTGAPGSGKTAVVQELEKLGYVVIHESATDVIGREQQLGNMQPWEKSDFVDKIIAMQKHRQAEVSGGLQFYDRSPFCTYALGRYLSHGHNSFKPSPTLLAEIDRCLKQSIYQSKVFFFESLGFIESTSARKISFAEALIFEKIHLDVYQAFGFEIIPVSKNSIEARCQFILNQLIYAPDIIKKDYIDIVPYDLKWPNKANSEINKLHSILPTHQIIDIQHVGSTAIPGMAAKPIIDIQIAVTSLEAIKNIAVAALQKLDYQYWAENPDPERMFFVKGMPPFGEKRTHHVHIVEATSKHWVNKIQFRDYLIAHSEAADGYQQLKLKLAEKHVHDREAYTHAKGEFVNRILKLAQSDR